MAGFLVTSTRNDRPPGQFYQEYQDSWSVLPGMIGFQEDSWWNYSFQMTRNPGRTGNLPGFQVDSFWTGKHQKLWI